MKKSAIVIIGIGLGIGFAACTADLRDSNVCVMYARALCNKAASCGLLDNQSADECLAPYLDDCEFNTGAADPRSCGAAIDNASCPGDTPVSLPDCKQSLSKADLMSVGHPHGGSGGTSNTGGNGGSGASGGSGGSGGTGNRGGTGGTTGGSGGSTGGSGGGTTGGSGGVGGTTGGSGGTSSTSTCSSYVPDSTYPCVMTVPSGCGTNAVSCGNNKYCAANSTCVTDGCQCNSGYLSVNCQTGLKCSGCAANTWGCTPKPNPGCTGNPSETAGVCTCSNGKTYNLACGTSVSCDQHCRQGF